MLAEFVLELIVGICLTWNLMPRREVTSGFFRIQMLLVLGLTVLAGLSLGRFEIASLTDGVNWLPPRAFCVLLGMSTYIGSVVWTLDRRPVGNFCVHLALLAALMALVLSRKIPEDLAQLSGLVRLAAQLTTAGVLGGSVTGMLLGHWYLTAPTMSIRPLSTLNFWFGLALVLRLSVSVGAVVWAAHWPGNSILMTWWALRWIGGIVLPLLLCVMVFRILQYRNTQAATGVLFAAVILVMIGELSAALLFRETGIPF